MSPTTAIESRDNIAVQLKALDSNFAEVAELRKKLVKKFSDDLLSLGSISQMNGGELGGVSGILSGVGSMLHQMEAASIQRVKLEALKKESEDDSVISQMVVDLLSNLSPNAPVGGSVSSKGNVEIDQDLEHRATDEKITFTPGELEAVPDHNLKEHIPTED